MKTELEHVYITKDGKRFINKEDAMLHEQSLAPEDIRMPVYYHFDDDGDIVYDFDEMESELETNILRALHIDCDVDIKEK